MKNKKTIRIAAAAVLAAAACFVQSAGAQTSTPPATEAEKEAMYTTAIEGRVADIIKSLNLTDEAKSNTVHDIIIAQYRVMRSRDALIDAKLKAAGQEINYANRAAQLAAESKILHENFLAQLGKVLTPAQVDIVKDKMTYNKVKVTYDAYCMIIPGLTDTEKGKIQELLKTAREEAIDGGSAPEKAAIFQKYKDQINSFLDANGHDTAKALKAWADAHPETNNPAAK